VDESVLIREVQQIVEDGRQGPPRVRITLETSAPSQAAAAGHSAEQAQAENAEQVLPLRNVAQWIPGRAGHAAQAQGEAASAADPALDTTTPAPQPDGSESGDGTQSGAAQRMPTDLSSSAQTPATDQAASQRDTTRQETAAQSTPPQNPDVGAGTVKSPEPRSDLQLQFSQQLGGAAASRQEQSPNADPALTAERGASLHTAANAQQPSAAPARVNQATPSAGDQASSGEGTAPEEAPNGEGAPSGDSTAGRSGDRSPGDTEAAEHDSAADMQAAFAVRQDRSGGAGAPLPSQKTGSAAGPDHAQSARAGAAAAASRGGAPTAHSAGTSETVHIAWHSAAAARPAGALSPGAAPAALSTSASLSEAESRQEIVDQLADRVATLRSTGGRAELRMALRPPELGRLTISLVMEGNTLHARLDVQNEAARQSLQSMLPDIRNAMQQSGLDLGQLSVDIRREGQQNALSSPESGTGERQGHARSLSEGRSAGRSGTARSWGTPRLAAIDPAQALDYFI